MMNENRILLYGSTVCHMVPPVRNMLQRASADFEYVNIFNDHQARERVRAINGGYESVPTLVFPDGSTLTEPSLEALRAKLQDLGYEIAEPAAGQQLLLLLGGNWTRIAAAAMALAGLVADETWLLALGLALYVGSIGLMAYQNRR
jgi:mycoredoxin